MFKKLPIGIQSFEKLREDNFLYVDKTALIYELVHNNTPYFLSRPRRFDKSPSNQTVEPSSKLVSTFQLKQGELIIGRFYRGLYICSKTGKV